MMGDVRFVRIKGRIVPIKSKKGPKQDKKSRDRVLGGSLIGVGFASAAGLGYAGGRLLKSAAKIGSDIQKFTHSASLGFAPGSGAQGRKIGEIMARAGQRRVPKMKRRILVSKGALKFSGHVFAGALVGEGISKIAGTFKKGELGTHEEIASDVAGVGVATLSSRSFKSGLGAKALKKILSRGRL